MASTDTIVGIVGAVLLAGVMVGVFVYEVNNAPGGPAAGSDAAKMDTFHADKRYAALNATGDIDHDGIANYKDDDIDGDGIANAKDNLTAYVAPAQQGSVPAVTPPSTSASSAPMTFKAEQGATHVTVVLTYTITTPNQIAGQVVTPNLSLTLQHPEGDSQSCPTKTYSGTTATCTVDAEAEEGTYTITVSGAAPQPQSASFSVQYGIVY